MDESHKIIFVVGPTASGKSAWALDQVQKFGGSIVNADSIQFYSDLKIGSAAPTEAEMQLVPHYLYGYVNPPSEMTAGDFVRDFYQLIKNKNDLKWPVYLVGGTGFYVQALEKGMYDLPPADPTLQKQLEEELAENGSLILHKELLCADPESKIHVNDHFRLVRALEIWRKFKIPPSQFKEKTQNKNPLHLPFIKIGFQQAKDESIKRITKRTKQMLQLGLIQETDFFLQQGFENWAPMSSVGYFQTMEYLKGKQKNILKLEQDINTATWQLVKKQKTWFKRDTSILWSDGCEKMNLSAQSKLDQFLNRN